MAGPLAGWVEGWPARRGGLVGCWVEFGGVGGGGSRGEVRARMSGVPPGNIDFMAKLATLSPRRKCWSPPKTLC